MTDRRRFSMITEPVFPDGETPYGLEYWRRDGTDRGSVVKVFRDASELAAYADLHVAAHLWVHEDHEPRAAVSRERIAYTGCMSTNLKPEELPGLVDKGLAMVEKRLAESNGARIYDSIKAQLTYMKQTIDANATPDQDKVRTLTLGVYAAREFETSDPEFADVLFKVEYLFKRL